jgi:hypothetical protein
MGTSMGRLVGEYREIRRIGIVPVKVDMVNDLSGRKWSPKILLSYFTVDMSRANFGVGVRGSVCDPISEIAFTRTKLIDLRIAVLLAKATIECRIAPSTM